MSDEWTMVYAGGPMASDPYFHPVLHQYQDLEEREKQLRIQRGTPIFIQPDHGLDDRLIRFFNSATWTSQSEGTRLTYAKVYRPFFTFMESLGKTPFDADAEDIGQWKVLRTDFSVNPEGAVSGATWNKEVAALDVLFGWAANPARGYMPSNPLRDLSHSGRISKAGNKRLATPAEQAEHGIQYISKNARSYRGKWLSPATYRGWRDIGLLGHQMVAAAKAGKYDVGLPDPDFRGRNKQRNRAWCDLVFMTGMRLQEASSLVICELPPQTSAEVIEFTLASETAKGGKGRMILEPPAAALEVQKYLKSERADAVRRAQQRGIYSDGDWLIVDEISPSSLGGTLVRWASNKQKVNVWTLPPQTRRRLLLEGPNGREPLSVWLTEDGLPMTENSWEAVFRAANDRYTNECLRVGVPMLTVSPHSLRFTYALMFLIALHKAIDEEEGFDPTENYDYRRYDRAYRRVQFQLGHSSLSTTRETYLEAVVDMRDEDLLMGATGSIGEVLVSLAERTPLVKAHAGDE